MPRLKPGQTVKKAVNTRMSDALREQLEAAAAAKGLSLSREIEDRLQGTLAGTGDEQASEQTRGLLDDIAEAIRLAETNMHLLSGATARWHEDDLTRRVARSAIQKLVRLTMGEDGNAEIEIHRADGRIIKTDGGEAIATQIIMDRSKAS